MVYSTVCYDREVMPTDFTPLKVDYFSRFRYRKTTHHTPYTIYHAPYTIHRTPFSAMGATTGAFHRRDSRGDDSEILIARLIDRPLRPTIREGWGHDTQVCPL
ncbi:hypothetical protein EON65_51480 [archaeon]|nr:MAG: hypothetical protein EON65_51480 [archaeon]